MQHNKPITELPDGKVLDVQDVHVYSDGPLVQHDYSCPICRKNHAVLNLSNGRMEPCWNCKETNGYEIMSGDEIVEIINETRKNTLIASLSGVLALFVIYNAPSIFG